MREKKATISDIAFIYFYHFELDNSVMTTPKRCSVLSFLFTCLCITKPLLTKKEKKENKNNRVEKKKRKIEK